MSQVTGSCFCGNVRYVVETADAKSSVCHCAGCRRASAAPAVAWITVPAEAFRVVQGELSTVRAPKTEPETCDCYGGTRGFCAACGSHVTYLGDDRQHEIDITTGTLDDPSRFPPAEDVFTHKKLSWMKTLA